MGGRGGGRGCFCGLVWAYFKILPGSLFRAAPAEPPSHLSASHTGAFVMRKKKKKARSSSIDFRPGQLLNLK